MYVIKLKTIILYAAIVLTVLLLFFSAGTSESDQVTNASSDTAIKTINDELPVTIEEEVRLPILMYHSICDDNEKQGQFVISRSELEKDFKYIVDNGYTAVSAAELIKYVNGEGELPQKPIFITFDDGYYNNYCYAYPLLKQYNHKAVISIIGKYTDMYSNGETENPMYSHITWDEAREMTASGLVEIENHSYDSHTITQKRNGTKKNPGESAAAYMKYISADVGKLQNEIKENLGYIPEVFAYPFGSISDDSFDILKSMGFKITLSCEEKVNVIKKSDTESLFMLGRYLRTNSKSAEKILSGIPSD